MITRRRFLAGTGAALVLAACGDDGGSGDDPATTTTAAATEETGGSTTTTAGDGIVLGEAFDRNAMLVAGIAQRAPFVLFHTSGGLLRYADAPPSLDFVARLEGGDPLPAVTVARRGEDVDRPYYPLLTTFPEPGVWTLSTEVDGLALESTVAVNMPSSSTIPQIGQPLPSAPTPTVADPAGADTICTRDPACPFHAESLDAVLASGRRVAVLLSTPAYCQVGICGPVLDLLMAQAPNHADLAVVHIEVYPNGAPSATTPPTALVTSTFGLQYEPALFVADATGAITARLDNIYDGGELAEVLA